MSVNSVDQLDDESVAAWAQRLCDRVSALPGDARDLVVRHVDEIAPLLDVETRRRVIARATARLAGLDSLQPWLDDPAVDEVIVHCGRVWVERDGRLAAVDRIDDEAVPRLLERMLAPLGRRLDRTRPIVDARLPDGSRLCAVVEPVAVEGPTLAIRRFRVRRRPVTDFADDEVADIVDALIRRRCNVVVTGATSSGKTSLLAAMCAAIPAVERLVVVEDTAELPIEHPHAVRLEARPATPDQPDPVTLDALVRAALRLRPDRILVGEVRGHEVLALVQALNTGHDGSLTSCHANGPLDALLRLESLVLAAAPSWPLRAIRTQLARSIDVIVHLERRVDGRRSITQIDEVVSVPGGDDLPATSPIVSAGRVVGELRRER